MTHDIHPSTPAPPPPAGTSNPDGTTFGTKTPDSPPATFETPGPGSWEYDRSHCPPAPTLLFRRVASQSMETAYRTVFEQYGAPLLGFGVTFVHGKMYRRLIPLIGGDKTGPTPPKPVLWLATRLHPAFRRREKLARKAITERNYLERRRPLEDRARGVDRQEPSAAVCRLRRPRRPRARRPHRRRRPSQPGRLDPPSRVARQRRRADRRPARAHDRVGPRSDQGHGSCSRVRRRRRRKAPSAGGGSPTRSARRVSTR